ncbi:MAG: HTH domain-containing protein [Chloroflexota bacterium]
MNAGNGHGQMELASPRRSRRGMMNALAAAEAVLASAGGPLHYREITRRMMDRGLWKTEGKTPDATVRAQLGTDVRKRGVASPFQHIGPGVFSLRARRSLPSVPSSEPPAVPEEDVVPASISLPTQTLSFVDAAEHVLQRFGDGRPMHYRDITEKALALGLLETAGQTPEQTLYAKVLTEIKRVDRRGGTPRFVKHGTGLLSLPRNQHLGLANRIEEHNARIREQLHRRLFAMSPTEFEVLIGELLVKLGFEDVVVTSRSGDGGIDVRGTLVVGEVIRTRMAVQVKRWRTKNVQAPTVQQVRGSLGTHDQGLIITTSAFSRGARTEAERPNAVPVALMNGAQLVTLMVEHDIGVRRVPYYLMELAEGPDSAE